MRIDVFYRNSIFKKINDVSFWSDILRYFWKIKNFVTSNLAVYVLEGSMINSFSFTFSYLGLSFYNFKKFWNFGRLSEKNPVFKVGDIVKN